MRLVQLVNLVADALVVEEKPAEVPAEVAVPVAAKELEGYKVLVIDDEPHVVAFRSDEGDRGE